MVVHTTSRVTGSLEQEPTTASLTFFHLFNETFVNVLFEMEPATLAIMSEVRLAVQTLVFSRQSAGALLARQSNKCFLPCLQKTTLSCGLLGSVF